MNKPPHIITTLPALRAAHPEAWAYLHVIDKRTNRLFTYGIEIDGLDWNGQTDDVLEDYENKDLPVPSANEIKRAEILADFAKATLAEHQDTLPFYDFGGQAFSEDLLPECSNFEAELSFEYEEE